MDAWASPWAEDQGHDDSSHRRTVSTIGFADVDTAFSGGADAKPARNSFINVDSLATPSFTSTLNQPSLAGSSPLPASDIWARDDNPFAGVSSSSAWANDTPSQPEFPEAQPSEAFSGWGVESSVPPADPLGIGTSFNHNFTTDWETNEPKPKSEELVAKKPDGVVDWNEQPDWGSIDRTADAEFVKAEDEKDHTLNDVKGSVPEERSDRFSLSEDIATVSKTTDVENNTPEHSVNEPIPVTAIEAEPPTLSSGHDANPVTNAQPDEPELKGVDAKAAEDEEFGEFDEFGEFEEDVTETTSLELTKVDHNKEASTTIDFQIDTSLVSNLYPTTSRPPTSPPVIDIISTIDARKAWYRISREGTMGKHKSGNSDDYVRVTWAKSKIREDVDKIVARWIKEGRFLVGGAIAGDRSYGAMFGWGEGASTRDHPSRAIRYSAPGSGLNLKDVVTHRTSASTSNWDPAATNKPQDSSPTVSFGWSSPVIPTPPKSNRNSLSAIQPPGLGAMPSTLGPVATAPLEVLVQDHPHSTSANMKHSNTPNLGSLSRQGHATPGDAYGYASSGSKPSISETDPTFHIPQTASKSAVDIDPLGWGIFESTNTSAGSQEEIGRTEGEPLPIQANSGPGWGSLDFFENKQAQVIPFADESKSPSGLGHQEVDPIAARGKHPIIDFSPPDISTTNAPQQSNNDDDEWGELVTTPVTAVDPSPSLPIHKERRPSTAHGDSRPFGVLRPDNWVDLNNNGFTRRDSAPSLAVKTTGLSPQPLLLNTEPFQLGQPPQQGQHGGAIDWDFSMFEQSKSTPPKARDNNTPTAMAAPSFKATPVSKDDQIVADVIGGLPDLGYMLH
ncbi:hypothetical protein DFH27DRAFT_559915 [Peziza echinospora]|nr:hypothetical protein DFH27DRAFT_559915 [Peziza echinospora]